MLFDMHIHNKSSCYKHTCISLIEMFYGIWASANIPQIPLFREKDMPNQFLPGIYMQLIWIEINMN